MDGETSINSSQKQKPAQREGIRVGDRGQEEPPYKVSDRGHTYMAIIAGYVGIYCHICIRIVHPPRPQGLEPPE